MSAIFQVPEFSRQKKRETLNARERTIDDTPQYLHGPNGIVFTMEDKAEVLADTVELNCRENDHPDEDDDFVDRVEATAKRLRRVEGNRTPFRPITPRDVNEVIKGTVIKKAPGKDGITNRMLKNIGHSRYSI